MFGYSLFLIYRLSPSERKKQPTPVKEVEKKDEEEWPLSEVIFVEDVKTVSIGKVLKVRASLRGFR